MIFARQGCWKTSATVGRNDPLLSRFLDCEVTTGGALETGGMDPYEKPKSSDPFVILEALRPKRRMPMEPPTRKTGTCSLCLLERRIFRHHLIPKSVTRDRGEPNSGTIMVCHRCHVIIHRFLNLKLAEEFNTKEKLRGLIEMSRSV